MVAKNLLSSRKILLRSLQIFLIWRCSLLILTFFGLHLTEEFDFERVRHVDGIINAGKEWIPFPNNYFLDGLLRFDSMWFDTIIQQGYSIQPHQSNVAFFPLYPYLSRWLGLLIGNHYLAGLLISNVSLIVSLFFIYRIGLLYFKVKTVERALILLLVFPSSFFLSTFYSESLFLLTTTASFYYFFKEKYLCAGIWGMLATLTRFTGILLFFAFMAEIIFSWWQKRKKLSFKMLFLTLIPTGIIIFMLILWIQVGEPMAFLQAQADWGRKATFPVITFIKIWNNLNFQFPREIKNTVQFFNWLSAIAFLVISGIMAVKRYPVSLWTYVAFSILLPLSTGTVLSMMRFCVVIFPVFFYLGELTRKPIVYQYLLFIFTFLLSIYSLKFMNWYFLE